MKENTKSDFGFAISHLSNDELIAINGGDNPAFDFGVKVGRSIVQFGRWAAGAWADYGESEFSYTYSKV